MNQSTSAPRVAGEPSRRPARGWALPKARRSRGPAGRFKLRYVMLAALCGWAFYHYNHVQRPQLAELRAQERQLEQRLSAADRQQAALRRKVIEFQSDQFIARYASEHFNLIGPGQVSFNIQH